MAKITRKIRTKNGIEEKTFALRKAIYYKCLDCCCFNPREVTKCTVYLCPLWSFRKYTGIETPPDVEKRNPTA